MKQDREQLKAEQRLAKENKKKEKEERKRQIAEIDE